MLKSFFKYFFRIMAIPVCSFLLGFAIILSMFLILGIIYLTKLWASPLVFVIEIIAIISFILALNEKRETKKMEQVKYINTLNSYLNELTYIVHSKFYRENDKERCAELKTTFEQLLTQYELEYGKSLYFREKYENILNMIPQEKK